jgi:hypothetical protein
MSAYRDLSNAGVTTRRAAALAGVSRATATRPIPAVLLKTVPAAPANQLTGAERAQVLSVLTEDRFVDATPLQIYAELTLDVSFTGDGQAVTGSVGGLYAAPYLSIDNAANFGNMPTTGQDKSVYLTTGVGSVVPGVTAT